MRIVFMGSPEFAVPSLENLVAKGHHVVAVYSQPPRKSGRGQKVTPTAVHAVAARLGIPVETPEKLVGEAVETLTSYQPDLICVAAYGLLLPQPVLDIAPCINVHPSALPRWRGAAPMNYPILSGETSTDVCIMHMEKGLDCGDVYWRESYEIGADETAGDLQNRLTHEGARGLEEVVSNWDSYKNAAAPQEGETTYAHKFKPEELQRIRALDFSKPAQELHNQIRGLSPFPVATFMHNGQELKVLRSTAPAACSGGVGGEVIGVQSSGIAVRCGDGSCLTFTQLQRAGKRAMMAEDFLNGYTISVGDVFASPPCEASGA